jgi:nicotinamide-nucleotide amidase
MVSITNLAVGKELLIGKTLNTNSHWMGARLMRMGSMFDRILTVTDSLEEISSGLKELLARHPDFVIVVGGLGPTPDDMTLKGVSLALGTRLKLNREALAMVKEHYAKVGHDRVEITPPRRKMATLPETARPLANEFGTAPGVRIQRGDAVIFCLPGVPKEMKFIYRQSIEPEIRARVGKLYTKKIVLHLEGISESTLAPAIELALKLHPASYIKSHPKGRREGRSRIELNIVVTSKRRGISESEAREIASFFSSKVTAAGGLIARQGGR